MPTFPVTSLDDPRVAPFRGLKGADPARESGLFIVESELLVQRAIQSRFEVVSILCADRMIDRIIAMTPGDVPIYTADNALLQQIVGFNFHRGVMAAARRPRAETTTIDHLLAHPACASARPSIAPARTTFVACPFLTQNENLGLILRAAAGLGAAGLILSDRGADPFSRQAVRVSTGASFTFPIALSADILADLRRLRERERYALVATVLADDAIPLHTFKPPARSVLLVGNEFEGLPPEVLALCDHRVTIPMHHGIDSLNVAMATGIVLHHLVQS